MGDKELDKKLGEILRELSDKIFEKSQVVVNDEYVRLQALAQIHAAYKEAGYVNLNPRLVDKHGLAQKLIDYYEHNHRWYDIVKNDKQKTVMGWHCYGCGRTVMHPKQKPADVDPEWLAVQQDYIDNTEQS